MRENDEKCGASYNKNAMFKLRSFKTTVKCARKCDDSSIPIQVFRVWRLRGFFLTFLFRISRFSHNYNITPLKRPFLLAEFILFRGGLISHFQLKKDPPLESWAYLPRPWFYSRSIVMFYIYRTYFGSTTQAWSLFNWVLTGNVVTEVINIPKK